MDRQINFFEPYQHATAWHENQLTRALLVVLRYSPIAHQTWLNLLDSKLLLTDYPKPEFATQQQRIIKPYASSNDAEAMRGISVWLAPDAKPIFEKVQETDRQQILDGVVNFGNELVIVIENKIFSGIATDQPTSINLHGVSVKFDSLPISIPWQKLLSALADLLSRDLVSGAERLLVQDFLAFVDEHFSKIGPYSTLERCGKDRDRLNRRLDAILGEVVGSEKGRGLGWRDIDGSEMIFMVGLEIDASGVSVRIQFYPGDTLSQSRAFYSQPSIVKQILDLRNDGWLISPNLHWGFTAAGYAWMDSPMPVEDYCRYWIEEIGRTKETPRAEWESYWQKLVSDGIVNHSDKQLFDSDFTNSKRQRCNIRPGLRCEFKWPLEAATKSDQKLKFADQVEMKLQTMKKLLWREDT